MGTLCRDSNLVIKYSFSLPNYLKRVGRNCYINMNLSRLLEDEMIDTAKQHFDKKIEFKRSIRLVYRLKIPQGATVATIPPSSKFDKPDFGYKVGYELDSSGEWLSYTLSVRIDSLSVSPRDFAAWNQMILQLRETYRQVVMLTLEQ